MAIKALNTDPAYIEFLQYNSDKKYILKNDGAKFQQEEKVSHRFASQEQKNTVVSEKLEENKTVNAYNLRLQKNTPTAKLLETIAAYHETQKTRKTANANVDFDNLIELTETDNEEQLKNSSPDQGYYMVIKDPANNNNIEKRLKSPTDIWREKINKKYNWVYLKESGKLVNVLV